MISLPGTGKFWVICQPSRHWHVRWRVIVIEQIVGFVDTKALLDAVEDGIPTVSCIQRGQKSVLGLLHRQLCRQAERDDLVPPGMFAAGSQMTEIRALDSDLLLELGGTHLLYFIQPEEIF